MAKKAKNNKKIAKKDTSRTAKKELEVNITEKFIDVIVGLGYDTGKIGKDIKKTSKQLAGKLVDKFQSLKEAVAQQFENTTKNKIKKVKKPLTSAKTDIAKAASKAEKVIAKATKANMDIKPAKRAYTRRAVTVTNDVNDGLKTADIKKPKPAPKTSTAKPVTGNKRVGNKTTPKTKAEESASEGTNTDTSKATEQNPQEETNNTI